MRIALDLAVFTVACALLSMACASAPPIEAMQTDSRCHVWARGFMGHAAARVDQGQATMYTALGEQEGAHFTSATEIELNGRAIGTYTRPQLVLHGFMGDLDPIHIGPRGAVVHGLMSDVVFEFNERCSDTDAAVAVTTLVAAIASQH